VGISFAYDGYDWRCLKGTMLSLQENFHAVVGAATDAEDLASQVSTEAQSGAWSVNLVAGCLRCKKFLEKYFALRGVDARHLRLVEG
jgi:hypothetical protein